MKRFLKIAAVISILLTLVIGGVVFYFYTNIQPILVREINKSLAVEVKVGDITVSGIRDFPNLGIRFSDVSIAESTPYYKKYLLEAQELNLFVDIMKLYKGEYLIDGVTVRNGAIRAADLNKTTNYEITKPSSDTSSGGVSFEIKTLKLINCDIAYEHTPSKFKSNAYSPSTTLTLKYEENSTSLKVKTTLDSAFIASADDVYVARRNLKINTAIDVVTDKEQVIISQSNIAIEAINLTTKGTIGYGNSSNVDITFANDNTTVKSLLSVLPASITQSLDRIKLEGNVEIDGYFKGETDDINSPAFGFDYQLQNTSLTIVGENISLDGIEASGELKMPNVSNSSSASATCKLSMAKSGKNTLSGNLAVKNFEMPAIQWEGKTNLDPQFIFGLIENSSFLPTDGTLKTEGNLALTYDIGNAQIAPNSLRFSGQFLVENLKGKLKNPALDVQYVNIDVSANDGKLVVNQSDFAYNNTTGTLRGFIENYQSMLNENSNASMVGELKVNNLVVNELYSTSDATGDPKSRSELFPINLKLATTLTDFHYNDFSAKSMMGTLISDKMNISMPKCKIEALEGNTLAGITIRKWGENHLLDITTEIDKVNISQLFKQFNNFEQSEITSEHLSGTLSGSILAKVVLDQNLKPIMPKLYAKANVTIENGALIGYEPLKELSSFVHIKDLENVKFKTLKNTIEIFDQTIFIPRMMIENNAMNLEIEGTHTFENYMKYSMGISVAELLATKANWIAKKAEKRIEKNTKGGLTAYVLMEGTPDNLKISYDRTIVKENVAEELTKEKKKFIQALKGEGTLEEETVETKNYDDVWDE